MHLLHDLDYCFYLKHFRHIFCKICVDRFLDWKLKNTGYIVAHSPFECRTGTLCFLQAWPWDKMSLLEGARGAEPGLQTGFPRRNENEFPTGCWHILDASASQLALTMPNSEPAFTRLTMSTPATPNPLPALYQLPRSDQEHVGSVYGAPIDNFSDSPTSTHWADLAQNLQFGFTRWRPKPDFWDMCHVFLRCTRTHWTRPVPVSRPDGPS